MPAAAGIFIQIKIVAFQIPVANKELIRLLNHLVLRAVNTFVLVTRYSCN